MSRDYITDPAEDQAWSLRRIAAALEERGPKDAVVDAARQLIEELRPREEDGHMTYAVAEPHTLTALQAALDDLDAD